MYLTTVMLSSFFIMTHITLSPCTIPGCTRPENHDTIFDQFFYSWIIPVISDYTGLDTAHLSQPYLEYG